MLIILLFAAPIIQTTLSVLRLTRKISIQLPVIFLFTLFGGFVWSFVLMQITIHMLAQESPGRPFCGTPALGALFAGIFVTVIVCPIIALICYLFDRRMHKKAGANAPA